MRVDSYLLSVIDGSRRGVGPSLLRGALAGLAYVYSAGLKLYLLPYRSGIRGQTRLPCPVISVGNLTVGGTGKTPMTRLVCDILQRNGLSPCVLSRGYRGANEHGAAVVSSRNGLELSAGQAGDEAHLLASLMPGVPVVVGKDRRITGALAYERFRPDVIVLDDGMQFYQLYRDIDIVLVDSQRPFDNGWTFPRGLLREPPSHIERAGCIVITNVDKASPESVDVLRGRLERLAPNTDVLTAGMAPTRLRALDGSLEHDPAWLTGRRVSTLSAIGNPESFAKQLDQAGATVVHRADFPDHHEMTAGELDQAIKAACGADAEAIIVTEKDAVKLPPIMRPLPIYVLAVTLVIQDEGRLEAILLKAVGK